MRAGSWTTGHLSGSPSSSCKYPLSKKQPEPDEKKKKKSNLGSFTLRNPLHMTREQSKSNLKHKVARAKKNAKRARKDAREANKAAQKARAKSDKVYYNAVAARDEILQAQRMATDAWGEVDKAETAHATAMKWAAFVEREVEGFEEMARGVREATRGVVERAEYCDHQFR